MRASWVNSCQAAIAKIDELWHKKLGHPLHQVRFIGVNFGGVANKSCEVYQMAKQTHSSFLVSLNKADFLF